MLQKLSERCASPCIIELGSWRLDWSTILGSLARFETFKDFSCEEVTMGGDKGVVLVFFLRNLS